MIYEYLVTAFKVVVGLVSNNILAIAGIVALGIMIIWVVCSLLLSYQFKFSLRARKLNKFVLNKGIDGQNKTELRYLVSKMPTEFYRGFCAFERNPKSLPSEHIKRFESLEMEISGGVFNQNKSILKTYSNFIFVCLLFLSFGLLSNQTLTGYLIAEAFVIPLAFIFLSRIVYYVYTAVRQYQYIVAVEDFNEVVDCLDKVAMQTYGYQPVVQDQKVKAFKPVAETFEQVNDIEDVHEDKEEMVEHQEDQPVQESSSKVQKIDFASLKELQDQVKQEAEQIVKEEKAEQGEEHVPYYEAYQETQVEPEVKEVEEVVTENLSETENQENTQQDSYEQPAQDTEEILEEVQNTENVEEFQPVLEEQTEEEQEEQIEEEQKPTLVEIKQENDDVILKFDFSDAKNVNIEDEKVEEEEEDQEEYTYDKVKEKAKMSVADNFKPNFETLFDEEEMVETPKRGRGRPKKVVSEDGEFVIHNDKEFEEALVRAEKLMRKNEEPLSASQTKRIEKQLKELIDAMSKYKEGK